METDGDDNAGTGKKKTGVPSPTPLQSTPSPSQDTSWVMQGLNQVNDRLNGIANDIADLKGQVGRVEGKLVSLPQIESRLQRLERHFWIAAGVLLSGTILWAVIQFLLSNFNIVVTPKP